MSLGANNVRIIPRLDIKGPNLVKGVHLEGLRIIGKPERFAKYYYDCGADELIYMDVVASLYGRNSLDDIIRKTSKEIFIPLTVGGGLRTLQDIQRVLRAGADKVALNTAAIANPDLIKIASREFGSSTIVVSIEALKIDDSKYEAFTDNGRERTGVDVYQWAKQVEDLGAGEILITSIDNEGTGEGFDLNLVNSVASSVSIPVIACGGAGRLPHLVDVIKNGKADAVSMASMLHYNFIKHHDVIDEEYLSEGNIEFLKSRRQFEKIDDVTLQVIKKYCHEHAIDCRYVQEVEV